MAAMAARKEEAMSSVYLVNERNTVLDIAGVQDSKMQAIALQPKGRPGSSREVPKALLEHPTVKRLLESKWLSQAGSPPKEEAPLMHVIEAPKVIAAVTPGTTNYPTGGPLSSPPVSDAVRPYTDNAPPYVAPATVTKDQAEIAQSMKPDDAREAEKKMPAYSEEMLKGQPAPPPPPAVPGQPPTVGMGETQTSALAQQVNAEAAQEARADEAKSTEEQKAQQAKQTKTEKRR